MTRNAYEFLRRNIHFADNSLQQPEGSNGYDPLFKVRDALDAIGKGLRKVWTAGKDITIDESMIKYCGRAVAFIQYMPAKPIKHGIKVFCACCAISGVMLAYEVYCGNKDKKTDGTAVDVCDRLVNEAELTGPRGRTLYTDNYYTSMKLAKHLFEKYKWTMVGTIVLTDKKTRDDHDIPFLKLSNGARNGLERGWFREACLKLRAGRTPYYVQCTTWKDKKQVSFLSTNNVGRSDYMTVQRRIRGKRTRDTISAPRAQADYVANYNAVDRNDRDSADYSTTIRTNQYYLRIFCWALDRVIHAVYVVVSFLVKGNVGQKQWKRYEDTHSGRHDFQIDLALSIMNYGVGLHWDGKSATRPNFMRQGAFVPCDCDKCFFCLNNITSGITHRPSKTEKVVVQYKCGTRVKTNQCTGERVDLGLGCNYCRMCYRKLLGTTASEQRAAVRKRMCRASRMGCPICNEPICKECWGEGYNKHA